MTKNLIKKLSVFLIISLMLNCTCEAGQFVNIGGFTRYQEDDGSFITDQWRWIDPDSNGIAECYRFDEYGNLLYNTTYNNRQIDINGCWVEDGVVKKMMVSSGKVLDDDGKNKDAAPVVEKIVVNGFINATSVSEAKLRDKTDPRAVNTKAKKGTRSELTLKQATDKRDELGRIISKGSFKPRRPMATRSNGTIIYSFNPYETTTYASGSVIKLGREMVKYITASTQFEKEVESANIYGGDVWKKCMVLKGDGAKVKFDAKAFNYFEIEIAHQKHGEATADTYCYIELYEDGVHTLTFDEFNDEEPQFVQEYIDDETKTIELRLFVTGSAPGRKVYLREGRFRNRKDKEDRED